MPYFNKPLSERTPCRPAVSTCSELPERNLLRPVTLTWPFPFLVRLGWLTAKAPNPEERLAKGRVYVLRGQGIIFSRGFGTICGQLRRAGWWAEDLRCVGTLWLRRHLRRLHQIGGLQGPVVLVGHSCGGRSALDAASWLHQFGVPIRLLVCVDVAIAQPVPGNVQEAVHLFRSRRRLYPARALQAAPSAQTVIQNIDLDAPDSPLEPAWLNHFNITASPAVQAWILQRILATGGKGTQIRDRQPEHG